MQRHLLYCLLFLSFPLEFTHCNGQVKAIAHSNPKLLKTQGSNEYANIHCAIQDKAGNLWFGTTGEGVYRYDGKLFTQFTVEDGLSNNTVWSVAEDKTGNIWLGTDDGISVYDGQTMRSVPIDVADGNRLFLSQTPNAASEKTEVWSIMQDKNGTIWFGTSQDLYCYNGKSFSRFLDDKRIVNKDSLRLKMIDCMLEDKNGNIWFASGMLPGSEGICCFNPETGELTSQKPYGNGWIRSIIEDKAGTLYIVTRLNGACRYDSTSRSFINFTEKAGIDNTGITTMFSDRSGNLWFATELGSGQLGEDGGVWLFDGKSFARFTTKDGLVHNGVWSIVEDQSGNLWFGTRNLGLCRFDGKTFYRFSQ